MPDHFSEVCNHIQSNLTWNSLHNVLTSVVAYIEHVVWSEFISQTYKLVSFSVVIQFLCPCPVHYFCLIQRDSFTRCAGSIVLLPVTVVLSIGYGGLAPMHIWLLEVAKWCCVFNCFEWTSRNCLIWYIRIPNIIIVATYGYNMANLSPSCHVWKICLSSEWVWCVYPCSLCHISLCKSGGPNDVVCEL